MRSASFSPVEPSAPDAQELLLDELADPAYAEAQPTWFDLLSQGVLEWFQNLRFAGGDGPPVLALIIGGALIAVAVLVAILIYGLPRRRARSRAGGGELFGESDRRTVRELRRASATAAAQGDFALAIAERFRALARALDERTLLAVLPGTTAHEAARQATRAFPDEGETLAAAADAFDGVRYQGRPGGQDAYDAMRMLDERLQLATPVLPPAIAHASSGAPA